MEIVLWILVGGLIGWVTSSRSTTPHSRRKNFRKPLDIVAGIGGSIVGGIIVTALIDAVGASSAAARWGELLVCSGTSITFLSLIGYLRQKEKGRRLHKVVHRATAIAAPEAEVPSSHDWETLSGSAPART